MYRLLILAAAAVVAGALVFAAPPPQGDDTKPPAKVPKKKTVARGTITGTLKSRWLRREAALVHVRAIKGMKFDPPKKAVVMDQENLIFKPHLLAILKGTTVQFPNSDSVRHNVYSPRKVSAKGFNLGTYDVGVVKKVVFKKAGEVPLLCNVHSEMSAYIIVTDTPFFIWTNKKGTFKIKDVPVGKRRLALWHERFRSQEVTVEVVANETVEAKFAKLKKR